MCEKQCRDENGFKCHMMSENHARQMQVFAQRPGRYMDEFSRSFEAEFMRFMRTRYCRTRVLANTVYCEVISNKTHTHMNSTVWVTLSEFVRYLDTTGKCKVEQTPRGFYLTFIDKEKEAQDARAKNDLKSAASAEALDQRRIQEAVKAAAAAAAATVSTEPIRQAMQMTTGQPPLKICLKSNAGAAASEIIGDVVGSVANVATDSPLVRVKKVSSDLFNAPTSSELVQSLKSKKSPTRLESLIANKKIRKITHDKDDDNCSVQPEITEEPDPSSSSEEENGDRASSDERQISFTSHPLENSDDWLSRGVHVRVTKKDWEWFDACGVVVKLEKSSGPAIVKIYQSGKSADSKAAIKGAAIKGAAIEGAAIEGAATDPRRCEDSLLTGNGEVEKLGRLGGATTTNEVTSGNGSVVGTLGGGSDVTNAGGLGSGRKLLRLGSRFLETIIPKERGRWVRICLGLYRGHEGRLIRSDPVAETADVLLFFGPVWGDYPHDIDLLNMDQAMENYKEGLKSIKNNGAFWARGELPLNDLPFDAIAQCKPPTGFKEFDTALPELDPISFDSNDDVTLPASYLPGTQSD